MLILIFNIILNHCNERKENIKFKDENEEEFLLIEIFFHYVMKIGKFRDDESVTHFEVCYDKFDKKYQFSYITYSYV